MKPQCETTPECLEQLARVMREFGFTGIVDAVNSEYIRHSYLNNWSVSPEFSCPIEWSFAIAKLEDKPVFPYSRVFFGKHECVVLKYLKEYPEGHLVRIPSFLLEFSDGGEQWISPARCSWTPPKQTVSIKVGDNEPVDVEKISGCYSGGNHGRATYIEHETLEAAEQIEAYKQEIIAQAKEEQRESDAELSEQATAYTQFQTTEHYKISQFIAYAIRNNKE